MVGPFWRGRMHVQRAEAAAERHLLLDRHRLVAEEQHLIGPERLLQRLDCPGAERL
jgi:hypothetical protein